MIHSVRNRPKSILKSLKLHSQRWYSIFNSYSKSAQIYSFFSFCIYSSCLKLCAQLQIKLKKETNKKMQSLPRYTTCFHQQKYSALIHRSIYVAMKPKRHQRKWLVSFNGGGFCVGVSFYRVLIVWLFSNSERLNSRLKHKEVKKKDLVQNNNILFFLKQYYLDNNYCRVKSE